MWIYLFLCMQYADNDMATLQLLRQKLPYLHIAEAGAGKVGKPDMDMSITFEYTFITIAYKEKSTQTLWLSIRRSVSFNIIEVWCKDATQTESFKTWFLQQESQKGTNATDDLALWAWLENPSVRLALERADRVGKIGRDCAHTTYGDAYYEKIVLSSQGILLEQTDYWNATSLDRENYCMRRLVMFIAFAEALPAFYNFQQKENLYLAFSDSSAPNYRACGKAVREAITEVMR